MGSIPVKSKVCNICGIEKPRSDFYQKGNKTKYACKSCMCKRIVEYREANKLKVKAARRKYYEANREKILAKQRKPKVIDDIPDGTKRCTTCKSIKLLSDFYKEKRSKDGLRSNCKDCTIATVKAGYDSEKQRARNREYYAKNRQRALERQNSYYQENKEARDAYRRKWSEANPGKDSLYGRVAAAKRRARKKRQTHKEHYTSLDVQNRFKAQRGKCWWCKSDLTDYHVDHIIPIAKGGSDSADNICISCVTCNLSKNAKMPHDFIGRLF